MKQLLFHKKITRRTIQICLGILWLIDGLLQLQPQMFTDNFANKVVGISAIGQPVFVSGPIHFFIHIFLLNPALFNSFSAITQLAIGLLILYKRSTKFGLIVSVFWALFVWVIGEGFSGIFSAHTLLLMGAPGAAIIYAIIALAVLPKKDKKQTPSQTPAYWLVYVWAVLWIGGAVYQLLPGQNSVTNVGEMIQGNGSGQPGWLASLDNHIGNVINGFGSQTSSISGMHMVGNQMLQMNTQPQGGFWFILTIVIIQIYIGVSVFIPKYHRKIGLMLGTLLSLIFWVVGQSFGGIFTGLATDPNSAILFILLALAILGCSDIDKRLAHTFHKIEKIIT